MAMSLERETVQKLYQQGSDVLRKSALPLAIATGIMISALAGKELGSYLGQEAASFMNGVANSGLDDFTLRLQAQARVIAETTQNP